MTRKKSRNPDDYHPLKAVGVAGLKYGDYCQDLIADFGPLVKKADQALRESTWSAPPVSTRLRCTNSVGLWAMCMTRTINCFSANSVPEPLPVAPSNTHRNMRTGMY